MDNSREGVCVIDPLSDINFLFRLNKQPFSLALHIILILKQSKNPQSDDGSNIK